MHYGDVVKYKPDVLVPFIHRMSSYQKFRELCCNVFYRPSEYAGVRYFNI